MESVKEPFVVKEDLDRMDDADYATCCKNVGETAEAMMTAAANQVVSTSEVLLALARTFGMLWSGLGGDPDQLVDGFGHTAEAAGLMFLSELSGTRMRGVADAVKFTETEKNRGNSTTK